MLKNLIGVIILLVFTYLQGSTAIKCYLCVGSTISDCANDTITAMGEQDCHPIHVPSRQHHHHRHRHHHHRHHHHHYHDDNPVFHDFIRYILEPTPILESAEDFEGYEGHAEIEENTFTTTAPQLQMRLEPSCMYMKIQASDTISDVVARGCGYMPRNKDFCTVMKKLNKNIVECESCDTDKCN